ncbi:MAG: tyrosine--tRNA ligase [Solirubrobacterales bacterium]|nr:tyrosine--tRNA ligase [Solirubrobacterales bacterium]
MRTRPSSACQSSIDTPVSNVTEEPREPGPEAVARAAALTKTAVEALPAGRLAGQLDLGRPLRIKLGIDPTAPDIHLGHTVVLNKLREFQEAGHQVVLIIGDYTARVGDPSGRSDQRPMLDPEAIDANAETFMEQAFKILDREKTEVRYNSEWLKMESDQLFSLMARPTVARLLERDDFQKRMAAEEPISLLELVYPLLQGYDSVAIDADVEIGGTDQKFNLLFGRDMQSSFGKELQSVMTLPILPGIDGVKKMSKSTGNYIGVTDPPEEMFGKVMRVPDANLKEYWQLLLSTDPPAGAGPNEAKRELGRKLVERFHGADAVPGAEEHFNRLFVRHEAPEDVEDFKFGEDPAHLPALVAGAFGVSRSEARRAIGQGGVKLDGKTLPAEPLDYPAGDLDGRVLQLGKRRFRRLVNGA